MMYWRILQKKRKKKLIEKQENLICKTKKRHEKSFDLQNSGDFVNYSYASLAIFSSSSSLVYKFQL